MHFYISLETSLGDIEIHTNKQQYLSDARSDGFCSIMQKKYVASI